MGSFVDLLAQPLTTTAMAVEKKMIDSLFFNEYSFSILDTVHGKRVDISLIYKKLQCIQTTATILNSSF